MKWIKTAIGAVIAISVIPLVVLSVINIKKSLVKTEKITFELEYYKKQFDFYTYISTIHNDDLNDYIEKGYTITNLYDYTHDISLTISNWNFTDFLEIVDNNSLVYEFRFYDTNLLVCIPFDYNSIYNANARDIEFIDIILTKNSIKNHKLIVTLISFVPIIFVGGVVLFFYKPLKKIKK